MDIIELIGIKLVGMWNGRKKENVGVLVYRLIGYDGYRKKENVMGQIRPIILYEGWDMCMAKEIYIVGFFGSQF